jgi:hypothetical protein
VRSCTPQSILFVFQNKFQYKDFDILLRDSILDWDSRIWGLAFKMNSQNWTPDLESYLGVWNGFLDFDFSLLILVPSCLAQKFIVGIG